MNRRMWGVQTARVVIALAAAAACVMQVRFAMGDWLFQKGGAENIRRALSYSPDNVQYLEELAATGEEDRVALLHRQLEVQPRLAGAWIDLATRAEFAGDPETAKRLLLKAVSVDQTWTTSWALTNYYYRAQDPEQFWRWARESLRLGHEHYVPLFTLCMDLEGNPANVLARLSMSDAPPLRAFIDFLRNSGHLTDAVPTANALISVGTRKQDLSLVQSVVDHLIETGNGPQATALWNALVRTKWMDGIPTNAHQVILNPSLRYPLTERGFDWRLKPVEGVIIDASETGQGVVVNFSGSQTDGSEPMEVWAPVTASAYRLSTSAKWDGSQTSAGLTWHISSPASNWELLAPLDQTASTFKVPAGTSMLRIRLRYQRPTGLVRVQGALRLREVLLEDLSAGAAVASATGPRP